MPNPDVIERRVVLGSYEVGLGEGEIADAIGVRPVVSIDDNYLSHSSSVSQALWARAGDDLAQDAQVRGIKERGERPPLASVVVSRLEPAGVPVFHAIIIDFDLGSRLEPSDLRLLFTNLLTRADEASVTEFVMPLLGAGSEVVSIHDSIRALLDVVASRALLSNGQRIHIRAGSESLAPACEAFDGWLVDHHRTAGTRVPTQPPPPTASSGETDRDRSIDAGSAPTGQDARQSDAPFSGGRWLEMARAGGFGHGILEAADELDRADNAHASFPALRLWSLLSETSREPTASAPELRAVLDLARSARNRLTHGAGDQSRLLPELLRGIEVLLSPQDATQALGDHAHILVGGVRIDWSREGTKHVRLLHDLLRTSLSADQLSVESERLEALGYRGRPTDRLLENCVADDPVDILQRHFSGSVLRAMLEERGILLTPSESARRLALRLLHQLGFPQRDALIDPTLVHRDLEVLASEAPTLAEPHLVGRIASISRSIEAVLQTYLRFLTVGLLDTPPDIWLAERARAKPRAGLPKTIHRATFGQLTILVRAAGKQIDTSADARTLARLEGLADGGGRVQWLPADVDELVLHRNVWVHGAADGSDKSLSLTEKRRQALVFCEQALVILKGLIQGPFPSVVVIEEIDYDSWGRRRVRARTSQGTAEQIFTDVDLIPGQIYLMHSRTNPLRVDPLLVRQGSDVQG